MPHPSGGDVSSIRRVDDGQYNRPNRDTWYTFRSFVRIVNDVDVDDMARRYEMIYEDEDDDDENDRDDYAHRFSSPPLLLSRDTTFEARYAISLLPNFANGHWTMDDLGGVGGDGDDIATPSSSSHSFERVLPLGDANVTRGDVIRLMLDNPNKLVLSPNWGTSWFA